WTRRFRALVAITRITLRPKRLFLIFTHFEFSRTKFRRLSRKWKQVGLNENGHLKEVAIF
ncbi:MAG: hypothetical protein ACO3S8_08210, partial [Aquiluna sp.]